MYRRGREETFNGVIETSRKAEAAPLKWKDSFCVPVYGRESGRWKDRKSYETERWRPDEGILQGWYAITEVSLWVLNGGKTLGGDSVRGFGKEKKGE